MLHLYTGQRENDNICNLSLLLLYTKPELTFSTNFILQSVHVLTNFVWCLQRVIQPRACALRALGLLLANCALTVGRGKTF